MDEFTHDENLRIIALEQAVKMTGASYQGTGTYNGEIVKNVAETFYNFLTAKPEVK